MRFDLDREQRAIQETAREICRRHETLTGDAGADPFWSDLAATGWAGIAVPERHGGQGLGLVELVLVVEELGHALAPGAFMSNAAAGVLIAAAGSEAEQSRWLPVVASGEARAAVAARQGDSGLAIAAGGAALVAAADDRTVCVAEPVPHLEPAAEALDLGRGFALLDLSDAHPLTADAGSATDQVEIIVAAELVGVAQHAMELAVDHAKQRQQFGRPIGAYQAVAHRCADMLIAVESARSTVLSAAWTADHEPERAAFAASVAKVTAVDAAWQVTTSALQVHGGIGFTWEHPMHRLLRRAAMSARLFGSVDHHLERLAVHGGLGQQAVEA